MTLRRLGSDDIAPMRALNVLFAAAFEDPDSYVPEPDDAYLHRVLGKSDTLVLVALEGEDVVGGLVGYLLEKLEQARAEFYIYDLAVEARHRRKGIATRLIEEAGHRAARMGAWVSFVQADHVDPPAIALYTKLGTREEVLHFDIPIPRRGD